MDFQISPKDKEKIEDSIRGKYTKVAGSPEGLFKYPTGQAALEILRYNPELIQSLSESVTSSYCGVGNPFSLGLVNEGETVLDIGCGAGVDTFFAAMMVGPTGTAVGIDIVPEMLERAEQNLKLTDLENVLFQKASGENLSFDNNSFDVVISNGVINLIPDKTTTLKEVLRVLKPGGLLMVADQSLIGTSPSDMKSRIDKWFQWEGGAIPGKDFLALIQQTGFENAEYVAETGLNSSPKTKGCLFRAKKPLAVDKQISETTVDKSLKKYQAFIDNIFVESALDCKTKHLIALGAALAAGCEPLIQCYLSAAIKLNATDEELKETMTLAMAVGATKIRILQEGSMPNMFKEDNGKSTVQKENEPAQCDDTGST